MKLIRDITQALPHSVVTIGNFDGLHFGHQHLLAMLNLASHELQLPSVMLTFEPNPTEFFSSNTPSARLMRFSEKWKAVAAHKVDYFYCARFNKAFAALSAEDFVKTILVDQLHAKKIIVGDDFRFGAKRAGNIETLKTLGKEYGFEVDAVPQRRYQEERISSTRIRNALLEGDFATAAALTGRPFSLTGHVAYGNQIGRTLGFPTANIHLRRKMVPMMGIFTVQVEGLSEKALPGVASIGYRPTFNGKEIVLEVFIFDFHQIIYGKKITVTFFEKIRDELKFASIDALVIRMKEDERVARRYFQR